MRFRAAAKFAASFGRDSLHLPKRHDQQVHGKDPDEDDLPESQIAGAVMVAGHFRVAVKEALPNSQNVKACAEHDRQGDAEYDSKRDHGIGVLVDDGKERNRHINISHTGRGLATITSDRLALSPQRVTKAALFVVSFVPFV
jgi:hypothetical protein